MLNGGVLDGSTLQITSDSVKPDDADHHDTTFAATDGAPYEQHDKPKAGIVAELLAKGYVLSEQIVHGAIEYDKKQGISTRFLNYIRGLDSAIGTKIGGPETTVSGKATEALNQSQARAKSIDEQHHITDQAKDYYHRAITSPLGQKVFAFYTDVTKQVVDVHEEAKRIAEHQKAATAPPATATAETTTSAAASPPTGVPVV